MDEVMKMAETPKLELVGLTKHYGKTKALNQLSFIFTPGIYGLLGPNGAGKSTLMNILAGILEPTSGQVLLNGMPIAKMGDDYRAKLGFVPQHQKMYDFYTAYQFLEYMAALKGLNRKEAPAVIRKCLEDVELTEHANKKVGAFSGGMKQRLLLAQALLNDPQILILDEPTAGLDPRQRIVLRNLIARVSINKIVFFATHVVSDLESISTKVLIMKEGNLINSGTVATLTIPIASRVAEFVVQPNNLRGLEKLGNVVSIVNAGDCLQVRLLYPQGEIAPVEHRRKPTLEDVYLDFFPEGG